MRYFGLIWRNVWRKKIRTSLTMLSVLVAFLLFALLSAVGYAFKSGADFADAERLVVIHKISLINPLPEAYKSRIASTEGVHSVTHATWFEAHYQDRKNRFAQFPVDPHEYMSMHPEFILPADQFEAWARNRTGIVFGKELADKFGFKIGDRVPIQSAIWTRSDGSQTWEFEVSGIMTHENAAASTAMALFHHEYFEESRAFAQGTVGWYEIRIAPGANPAEVAKAVDLQFANSPNETKTSTEAAFAQSFAKQLGNIALIVTLILGAVFFTLLLMSGNTMSQSVRERIPELAVLKTLGFSDRSILGVVLSESILIMLIGGLLGMGIGWVIVQGAAREFGTMLPGIFLSPRAMLSAVGIMFGAGIAAGLFPALKAMRLSIVDALARA